VSQYQKGKTKMDFIEATDSEWQWHQLGGVLFPGNPGMRKARNPGRLGNGSPGMKTLAGPCASMHLAPDR